MNYLKPMTSATIKDLSEVRFPVLASPKFDGYRATIQGGVCLTRNLKPFPNKYLHTIYSTLKLEGIDGELVAGLPYGQDVYPRTNSAVTSHDGEPDLTLFAFDYMLPDVPYKRRLTELQGIVKLAKLGAKRVVVVEQKCLSSRQGLELYLEAQLKLGYEGAMLRSADGPYKHGRATLREHYLMKLKPFEDSEAVVLGVEEAMENTNEEGNIAGKRRSLKAGMIPKGTLGKFVARDLYSGQEFKIGTGTLRQVEAQALWNGRKTKAGKLEGRIIKYKFQRIGMVKAPRQPIFLGWRSPLDVSH